MLHDWIETDVKRNLRLGPAQTLRLAKRVVPNLGLARHTLEAAERWCQAHGIYFTRHQAVGQWLSDLICPAACCALYGAHLRCDLIPASARRAASVPDSDGDSVYVSPDLEGTEAVCVAFHEIGHRALHGRNPKVYNGDPELKALAEYQANIIGVVAALPRWMVRGLTAEEIQERFQIRPELAELRADLALFH
jgi:hypothetical protein